MGYLTNYSITAYTDKSNMTAVLDDVNKLYNGLFNQADIPDNFVWFRIYLRGSDAVKWYEHEFDMMHLSIKHPTVKFVLEGVGEEQGDVWYKLFLGGKMKVVKPTLVWPSQAEVDKQEWK